MSRLIILFVIFMAGCATVQSKPPTLSQGGKSLKTGTGNVTVTKMLDGRQNVEVNLIGQPLF